MSAALTDSHQSCGTCLGDACALTPYNALVPYKGCTFRVTASVPGSGVGGVGGTGGFAGGGNGAWLRYTVSEVIAAPVPSSANTSMSAVTIFLPRYWKGNRSGVIHSGICP